MLRVMYVYDSRSHRWKSPISIHLHAPAFRTTPIGIDIRRLTEKKEDPSSNIDLCDTTKTKQPQSAIEHLVRVASEAQAAIRHAFAGDSDENNVSTVCEHPGPLFIDAAVLSYR
jgi:hypothetical protein